VKLGGLISPKLLSKSAAATSAAILFYLLAAFMPSSLAADSAGSSCNFLYQTILYADESPSLICLKSSNSPNNLLWHIDSEPDHWKYITDDRESKDSLAFGRKCIEPAGIPRQDVKGREFTCQIVLGRVEQIWFSEEYSDAVKPSLPVVADTPINQASKKPEKVAKPSPVAIGTPSPISTPSPTPILTPEQSPTPTISPSSTPSIAPQIEIPGGNRVDEVLVDKVFNKLLPIAVVLGITAIAGTAIPSQPQRGADSPISELTRIRTRDEEFGLETIDHGIGDDLKIWRFKWIRLSRLFESFIPNMSVRFSQLSQSIANTISEAQYLRAISGSFSLVLYPVAVLLGSWTYSELFQEKSMSVLLIYAVLSLGIIDPLAGLVHILTMISFLIFNGQLFQIDNLRNLIWIGFIAITPIFIAKSIRPLTRLGRSSIEFLWARSLDLLLGPLVTSWVLVKILQFIGSENSLIGSENSPFSKIKEMTDKNQPILLYGLMAILVLRYLMADLAQRAFPLRLNLMKVQILANKWRTFAGSLVLASIFTFLLYPMFPKSLYIPIALSIAFVYPSLLSLLGKKELKGFRWLNIEDSLKIVFTLALASLINIWSENASKSPQGIIELSSIQVYLGIFAILLPLIVFPSVEYFSRNANQLVWQKAEKTRVAAHIALQIISISIIWLYATNHKVFESIAKSFF
jgi:hypothetical protein